MPTLFLNTCGTSLLTGGGIPDDLRRLLNRHANTREWSDMPKEDAEKLLAHAESRRQTLFDADTAQARRSSAELNGLLSWQQRPESPAQLQDMHLLLATDTALGKHTAESVALWLQRHQCMTTVISAPGLNTASLTSFRHALSGLVRELHELLGNYKHRGYAVAFNLTGGFKGLNGFLQALSTLYADNTFYLFEGSSEVLLIPSLPLTLNAEQVILDHLTAFRRLQKGLRIDAGDCDGIPELLLFHIDEDVMLSEWGELLWRNSFRAIYTRSVWPSPSRRIIFGPNLEASCKGLPANLIQIINERVDDMAAYAESDCRLVLKSLDPKQLQGSQLQGLWECDLDAHHRIFMRKQGHVFTLEKVDAALH